MKNKNFKILKKIFPLLSLYSYNSENIAVVSCNNLFFSLVCLKRHINYQYKILSYIAGIDFLKSNYRFGVIYDLLSLTFNSRLRIKVFVNESIAIDSIVSLFQNANWWEREVWDLYGIYFNNHPDLRRILTDYGFEGYPMRKDFPPYGYVELKYDLIKKRIILEPVQLVQDFRSFVFETPW